MKLISGFLTPLALIAFSTSTRANQCISDLNSCLNDREDLEEKVIRLESEIENLKRNNELQTCQKELAARTIALETCQKTLDEEKSRTQTTTTLSPTPAPDYPCAPTTTSTLPPALQSEESLNVGESRNSSNGEWQLTLLSNGNLVIRNVATSEIIWSTNTTNSGATRAAMNSDGNFVLYGSSSNALWSSGTNIPGSSFWISNSGKLVISDENSVSYSVGGGTYPCGTFIQYDASRERLAPTVDGFSAGKYFKGTEAYIGIGNNSRCTQYLSPGRISVDPTKPGAYFGCNGLVYHVTTGNSYLLNNQNYYWTNTNSTAMLTLPKSPIIVKFQNTRNFFIGRCIKDNVTYVGKVHTDVMGHNGLWYLSTTYEVKTATDFEVLMCQDLPTATSSQQATTTNKPTIAPSYPCGTLLDAETYDPVVNGFLSGVYKDGSPLYPGVGYYSGCGGDRPAKVSKHPSFAFVPCGTSEISTDQNVKFFASHPNLQWVLTDKASVTKLSGHIPILLNSTGQPHYITRHKFIGYQQIGIYYVPYNGTYYWKGTVAYSNDDFEVLVCQSSPATTPAPVPYCTTCGELIPFNSDNNPSNPNTAGFASGTWIDGSTVYAGVGDFPDCGSYNRLSRISASFIRNGPGAYSPCGTGEIFSSTRVKYFCNHPNLAWVVANQSTINSIPGKQVQSGLVFLRFQVTNGSSVYQQIGYKLNSAISYFNGSVRKHSYPENYEVLTCSSP